jgi:hypothetical protein
VRILESAATAGKQLVEASSPPTHPVGKKAPPRVIKPSKHSDLVLAPAELEPHKAALRDVFGETLSDEFVDVMLTQLVSALRPGPFDVLDEGTLNAAIALVASVKPQSELEALIAVNRPLGTAPCEHRQKARLRPRIDIIRNGGSGIAFIGVSPCLRPNMSIPSSALSPGNAFVTAASGSGWHVSLL